MSHDDPDYFWAEISAADVLFLTPEGREQRVIAAYGDAIPLDKPFAWDAARGQLELFASLGVKAELARKVISEMSARFDEQDKESKILNVTAKKPVHLIVFAGHRVDAPSRAEPRFPPVVPRATSGCSSCRISPHPGWSRCSRPTGSLGA